MSDLDVYQEIKNICDNAIKELKSFPNNQANEFARAVLLQIASMANTILLIEKCDPIIEKQKD